MVEFYFYIILFHIIDKYTKKILNILKKLLTNKLIYGNIIIVAGMVKLADTRVLEARAARREGSSPFTRTIFLFFIYFLNIKHISIKLMCLFLHKFYLIK